MRRTPCFPWLLIYEIAIALLVTICTGLLLRSLVAVVRIDPRFRMDHLLVLKSVRGDYWRNLNRTLDSIATCLAGCVIFPKRYALNDMIAGVLWAMRK